MRKSLTGVRGERAQARPAQQAELKLERQACRVYEAEVRWRSGAGGAGVPQGAQLVCGGALRC